LSSISRLNGVPTCERRLGTIPEYKLFFCNPEEQTVESYEKFLLNNGESFLGTEEESILGELLAGMNPDPGGRLAQALAVDGDAAETSGEERRHVLRENSFSGLSARNKRR
jgi:hypothetical protein